MVRFRSRLAFACMLGASALGASIAACRGAMPHAVNPEAAPHATTAEPHAAKVAQASPSATPAAPVIVAAQALTPAERFSPEIRAARDHAQRRILRASDALMPDLPQPGTAQPSDLPGVAVALEQPVGSDALAHFHAALEQLVHADEAALTKVRIAVYGASGTTADMWTAYVRAYLQRRFGDGGPGIVAAAPHARWYHHNEINVTGSSGWVAANPQRKPLEDASAYGLMLVLMRGIPTYATADREGPVLSTLTPARGRERDLRVARYEVWSRTHPHGGSFTVAIDGAFGATINTQSKAPAARYDAFEVPPGPHTLSIELKSKREVQLFGVLAESDQRGIVLDNLGFIGARSSALVQNDEAVWSEQMRRRRYDLYLISYGTNEGFDDRTQPIDAARFEADFSAMLARFERAAPEASCIVMLPGLHDAVPEGALSPAPRIATIRPIMTRLAFASGCATWDAALLEGPPDGMRAWVQAGLAREDYVHLTARGHARYGMAIGDALMQAWDQAHGTQHAGP